MKKHSNVLTLSGGGGSALNRLPALMGLTSLCHSGLDPESIHSSVCELNAGQTLNQVQGDTGGRAGSLMRWTACGQRIAFTMAEILLSLTIIGVVAAITLPSLTGNINERTWNTQRKALYARFSQAIALMPALNGYGTLTEDENGSITEDTAAETFVTEGLSKVLKINNICDNEHLADCGVVSSLTNMAGSTFSTPTTLYELSSWFQYADYSGSSYSAVDSKAAAFETQNGESIVAYYNQSCRADTLDFDKSSSGGIFGFPHATMCLNLIYDLNGSKGPNTVGKDIGFITVFNATDANVVAPMPSTQTNLSTNFVNASKSCTTQNAESRLPTKEELAAMALNQGLIDLAASGYWSSSLYTADNTVWTFYNTGPSYWYTGSKSFPRDVRCIKR